MILAGYPSMLYSMIPRDLASTLYPENISVFFTF